MPRSIPCHIICALIKNLEQQIAELIVGFSMLPTSQKNISAYFDISDIVEKYPDILPRDLWNILECMIQSRLNFIGKKYEWEIEFIKNDRKAIITLALQ